MNAAVRYGNTDGYVDASIGKAMDQVKAFNRAAHIHHLPESFRAAYAASYVAAYETECDSRRSRS